MGTNARHDGWRSAMAMRLASLRTAMVAEEAAEEQELASPAEDRGEDTTPSQHPADVASDLERRELVLIRHVRDTRELHEIDAALERIANGTYGRCVDCGREIPRERLEVRPEAARDVECERRARRDAAPR